MPHTNPYVPRDVGLRLRAAVRRQLSEPSSCVPAGAVMLSAVNSEQAALRKLALSKVAHLDCLMHRFITLVWDHDGDESGSSVRAASPSIPVTPSSLYHYLTWSKWFVLSSALVHARAALFVDADVLLLRNPFSAPELSWLWREERSDDGPRLPLLLHQFEGHGGSPFNSGQLLVTSLAPVSRALAAYASIPRFDGATSIEQEIAYRALLRSRFNESIARLPTTFAGNCWFGPPDDPPWCGLYSFHAHCTPPALAPKMDRLRTVLREYDAKCLRGTRATDGSPRIAGTFRFPAR